ncbi:putative acyl-CoA synthetase [Sesbania bispinosa]|nr:putative acyl-CoA synthetase [Sesbania bispinosa]
MNNIVTAAQLPPVVRCKAVGEEGHFRFVKSLERVTELGVLGEGKELQWRFHGGETEHEWCDKVGGGCEVARCFSSGVGVPVTCVSVGVGWVVVSCTTRPHVAGMKVHEERWYRVVT